MRNGAQAVSLSSYSEFMFGGHAFQVIFWGHVPQLWSEVMVQGHGPRSWSDVMVQVPRNCWSWQWQHFKHQPTSFCCCGWPQSTTGCDTLLVGTPTNFLAYNVEKNSNLCYKDVSDRYEILTEGSGGHLVEKKKNQEYVEFLIFTFQYILKKALLLKMVFWNEFLGLTIPPFNHKIRLTAPSSPWIGTPALSLIIPWGYLSLMNYSIKKKGAVKKLKAN